MEGVGGKPLWVIFCHLPEKGTKEKEKIAGKMKERDREEREETEEIKTFLSTLTCYKDSKPCHTVSQYQLDTLVHKILNTFAIPNH